MVVRVYSLFFLLNNSKNNKKLRKKKIKTLSIVHIMQIRLRNSVSISFLVYHLSILLQLLIVRCKMFMSIYILTLKQLLIFISDLYKFKLHHIIIHNLMLD